MALGPVWGHRYRGQWSVREWEGSGNIKLNDNSTNVSPMLLCHGLQCRRGKHTHRNSALGLTNIPK